MRDEYKIKCNYKFVIINDLESRAFALVLKCTYRKEPVFFLS